VPARLRPTGPIAADAVLVGDPGRALLLAQALLQKPKMSNHARGLWGYYGMTPDGDELTIQSTGMGGPSAVLVLEDLSKLGVRRTIRVGTCVAFGSTHEPGDLLVVEAAVAIGGSAAALGVEAGARVLPDAALGERLVENLGRNAKPCAVASVDTDPARADRAGAEAADMQTAPLLARARSLDVAAAAVLIVAERTGPRIRLAEDALEGAVRRAGEAAKVTLSG
jgi:uridine phosphorylase